MKNTKSGALKRICLTDREEAVIKHAHFFEAYKEELKGLFTAIDRLDKWSDNPRDMLDYLRTKWIGREHGNDTTKDQFTDEQIAAAWPYLDAMGLTAEYTPDVTGMHFDHMIILGGSAGANYRRLAFGLQLLSTGAAVDTIILFVGVRMRSEIDGTSDEILRVGKQNPGGDARENPWVQKLISQGAFDTPPNHELDETDLGRIAMLQLLGNTLMPYKIEKDGEDGDRAIKDYYFRSADGQEIVLINAAAVSRGTGLRRHTSKSCVVEWLERHAPKQNARVLYITDNPSTLRTAQDTLEILKEHGREDIELIAAGPKPRANHPFQTYLGEIARLIDHDVQRNGKAMNWD